MSVIEHSTVGIILKECLGWKKGEHLLIVCDDQSQDLAGAFYNAAKKEKIETLLLKMSERKMHGEEPPKEVAAALKAADIAILLTSMSLSHTRVRKEACLKFGTRIASLPGATAEMLQRSIKLNYPLLKIKTDKLANLLSKSKDLEVYSNNGTHLKMSIQGRKGFSDHGLYTKPGSFGNLPAGEVCVAPREGTTNGCLVVDGSAAVVGRIKHPQKMLIKDGFVQRMPLVRIASLIKPLGRAALSIAEFGIGLNPKAKVTGNVLEDEKAKQTAHVAIGANTSFGGRNHCPCHLDFVFFNPIIFIDGKRVKV